MWANNREKRERKGREEGEKRERKGKKRERRGREESNTINLSTNQIEKSLIHYHPVLLR
jgi:hypothetical protein